jgi:hypothetical protein
MQSAESKMTFWGDMSLSFSRLRNTPGKKHFAVCFMMVSWLANSSIWRLRVFPKHQASSIRLHADEPFLRDHQSLCHSRISQCFMEPEGLLLFLQNLTTGPYSKPDRSRSYYIIQSCLCKRPFNIILPPMTIFLVVSFHLAFPLKSYTHPSSPTSPLPPPPSMIHALTISLPLTQSF